MTPDKASTAIGAPLLAAVIDGYKKRRQNGEWCDILEGDKWKKVLEAPPRTQVEVVVEASRRRDEQTDHMISSIYAQVMQHFLRRSLPYEERELLELLMFCSVSSWGRSALQVLQLVKRFLKDHDLSDAMRAGLQSLRDAIGGSRDIDHRELQKIDMRIGELLGEVESDSFYIDDAEPFAARILADIEQLSGENAAAMRRLLSHASTANAGRPSKRWCKEAAERLGSVDGRLFSSAATVWLDAFNQPRSSLPTSWPQSEWAVSDVNANLLKGIIWCASLAETADADLIRAIGRAGISAQKKIPTLGPRCTKLTNAAAYALGAIDDPLALAQLAILRSRIKNRSVQKQMEKALLAAAQRLGVSEAEVEEMVVPTFGLTDVGQLEEQLGDFTAVLRVEDSSTVTLSWRRPDGKPQKTVPKWVKEERADDVKELKAAVKDIQKFLPTQRERLDGLYSSEKSWSLEEWRERYLDHPIVGVIARRLIWVFASAEKNTAAAFAGGTLIDVDGASFEPDEEAVVSLWHPIQVAMDDVLAWRARLTELEITQPFKQAHREIYVLTDAERNTRVYSNRYAAHILKQHQFHALCGARGWNNKLRLMVDDEYPPAFRHLPAHGVRAEYWIEGAGEEYERDTNEAGTFHYLVTDQVRFYAEDAMQVTGHAGGGGYGVGWRGGAEPEAVPLEEVPAIVFSEVMRDVDLFVGVASVGNDPAWMDRGEALHQDYWQSYAFGELSTSAEIRRGVLEELIPRLKIASQCSFEDRFLVVRGRVRTYKIHLGSGNILMEPNAQYLCIVPKPANVTSATKKVFLPFEGDRTLSLILSKALLLAADNKITDTTILSQIRAR